ncbi:MAG: putative dipeptidase PepE [Verrucomicrobia subdivision 3 bacterium]|nr:putative dipeptidase PepE [Limisphaerales bacterium]MCS1415791.1 putative dipeptidase PepE [Limisphaerales bacterium]
MPPPTRVFAGIPAINRTLYHRLCFSVGDPVALIEQEKGKTLILRDIEMERARRNAQVHHVHCPADFPPAEGLSGDRETATAQALAEFLAREGISQVEADRSFPLSFAEELRSHGISLIYNPALGVMERRSKDAQEIEWLCKAQKITAATMTRACQMVAKATATPEGSLQVGGSPLTSERLQSLIDVWLLEEGFSNPGSIVAGGPQAADCHFHGSGPLFTSQPIIIDIFPCDKATNYNGDCTRTVVHGDIPEEVAAMHQAIVAANAAGTVATKPGITGEAVHLATIQVIEQHGFRTDRPAGPLTGDVPSMTHGTGHGIGLETHEPPLLDFKGPELVVGDALTIEPGLYSPKIGGVRVEDLVVVTSDGCQSLNPDLPVDLDWS